jgi:endonuclease G, mitochondrial
MRTRYLGSLICAIFLVLGQAGWAATGVVDESLGDCDFMVEAIGMPIVKGSDRAYTLVCREGHVLAYSDAQKTPIWVVERLSRERFVGGAQRASNWRADPDLPADIRAVDADYDAASSRKKRKFDRGHMAPAASMKWDDEAMRESFFLSNAAPQHGHLMNRHVWADLEFMVRDWTCDRGELYVITGPIYDSDSPETIGGNKIAVPTAFYKVAYEPRQRRAVALILPNEAVDSRKRDTADVLAEYVKPLSEVEKRTGVLLFDALDARDRNRIRRTAPALWGVANGCKLPRN